eukprot:2592857-Rhodomonas_salina.1
MPSLYQVLQWSDASRTKLELVPGAEFVYGGDSQVLAQAICYARSTVLTKRTAVLTKCTVVRDVL